MHQNATWYGVGLSPGDFVLDGDPVPLPKKGQSPPNFRPMFIVAKRLDGSLGTKVGLNPGDCMLDGDSDPLPTNGVEPPPHFSAHFYCGQTVDASRCHLVWK